MNSVALSGSSEAEGNEGPAFRIVKIPDSALTGRSQLHRTHSGEGDSTFYESAGSGQPSIKSDLSSSKKSFGSSSAPLPN